jgi:uncharacterized protein involved in exopolysaccharide biosynthesis
MPDQDRDKVNLLDFLAFLIKWRKFLAVLTLASALIVTVVSFLVTPKFRSTAVVRVQEEGGTSIGSLISSKLGGLGGISSLVGSMGELSGEFFIAILNSRMLGERIVAELDLRKVYGMEKATMEEVLSLLKANTRFELDIASATITIYAEDSDPMRAKRIAELFVEGLDRRNRELKSTRAKNEREFVSSRLEEARGKLTSLEDSLYRFQLQTGILNVEEQVKATLQAAAQLEAQRLATQTELEMTKKIFDSSSPEIGMLRIKLASIDTSLQNLIRKKSADDRSEFLVHLQDAASEGLSYLRLMRDLEIQQLLVGFLLQSYEQAKLEEVRTTPTIQQVDAPSVPTKRVWPRRSLMVLLGAFGAFVLGLIIALAMDFFGAAANDPSHPQHSRILRLRQSWSK